MLSKWEERKKGRGQESGSLVTTRATAPAAAPPTAATAIIKKQRSNFNAGGKLTPQRSSSGMPLLADSTVLNPDGTSLFPYGMSPGLDGKVLRDIPDHAGKTWKAYHERQARLAEQRQYSRPVVVDHLLWGDLLSGKLAELVEGERNHPRSIVYGGAADRDGGRCLLPGKLWSVGLVVWGSKAIGSPSFLRR